MRKTKHNKKRNTGFLYEALIRELTKSVINNDVKRKAAIVFMIKEHFAENTFLSKELDLYKALKDLHEIDAISAEKILFEAKEQYKVLNKKKIFSEQSFLINKINRILSKDVFSNFVPNYKDLATIAQIFSDEMPLKTRVLLEQSLIKGTGKIQEKKEMVPIDDLVYKTFVKKFNDKYDENLIKEQKELLSKYISSFADNGLDLKVYLNEEIGRLKQIIEKSMKSGEIKKDLSMLESAKKVLNVIGDFRAKQVDANMLEKVLKIQNLVSEIQING
tara:strand:+ start:147 stop:971 length:825 start_codon:yes stop_codon:yes gene_type:complete